jgi:hypothetical protein
MNICRTFQRLGHCKYADRCKFIHGQPEQTALPSVDKVFENLTLANSPSDRVLIICDLNGFLFERVRINKSSESNIEAKVLGIFCFIEIGSPMICFLGSFRAWQRPHMSEFLDFLFAKFDVAVWSSAQKHNVDLMLRDAFCQHGMFTSWICPHSFIRESF